MANVGDTLTVQAEEIILQPDGDLAWLGAHVVDVDKARKEPYYANQAVDLARRGHVLQDARPTSEKAKPERESSPEPTGPRAQASAKFWAENWWKMIPKSGEGQYTLQHHWRGLSEDEAKLDEKDLLKTDHSVHGDLRLTGQTGDLWGFSVFTGTTEDLRKAGGCRLCNLPPDDALQGAWKLEEPREWLEVARHKPYVSEPEEAGATSKKYAKFFEEDYGRYHVGVCREHFFELFLDGDKLKGRYLIQYMPVGGGKRAWVIARPESQMPYAEAHKLESVLKELKRKKQPVLIWSDGKERPVWYDVATGEEFDPTKRVSKGEKADSYSGVVIGLFVSPEKAKGIALDGGDLPEGSKILEADELHLTLVFLGDKNEIGNRETIESIVSQTARDYPPIRGKLGGVGRFEHDEGDGTNALYSSFDSPILAELRPDLVKRLKGAGTKYSEEHGFTPHITLAYVPKEAETPDIRMGDNEIEFNEITFAWGNEHRRFGFAAKNKTLSLIGEFWRKFTSEGKKADSFKPPKTVQKAAARGLELRRKFGRGGTEVGVARARDLSNGRPVSADTIKRMTSYFARHAVDAEAEGWGDEEKPSAGWIAHLLWGGDAGRDWAEEIMEKQEGKAIGEGMGVGGPRQGVGGTDACVCPECGAEAKHERGTPCAEVKCPKCGAPMEGKPEDETKALGDWAEELGEEAYKAFLGHAQEAERLAEEEIALLTGDELENLVGDWLATTQEGQKAGRRLAGKWVKYLEDLKAELDDYVGKLASGLSKFLTHAKYEDEQETMPDDWASLMGRSKSGFKSFVGKDGKRRWMSWAASAFEDLEGEIFKTKALEEYVAEANKRDDHGELWFYHIPFVRLGTADFTALFGDSRILFKMGTWTDNPVSQEIAAYFDQHGAGWGASVGYKYRPKDREDKIYDWLWVFETSPVPAEKAAFPFSRFDSTGGKRMDLTKDQKAKLQDALGDDWKEKISKIGGETASKYLEDMGWAFKLLKNDDLSSVLSELIAEEAIAEKAKANPVQMLKLAMGKVKDEAAKGLIQKVIDALEKGDYQYPKPSKMAKGEEEYGKPKEEKAEGKEEEYPKPKKAKKDAGDVPDEREGGKATELPVQIEIEGLNEIVEAVKTIGAKVEEQGQQIAGLKAMLDAGDEERAAQKVKKAPPIVAYKASIAGLLDDVKEEGNQEEGAKMSADHPLARLSAGTPLGPRGG